MHDKISERIRADFLIFILIQDCKVRGAMFFDTFTELSRMIIFRLTAVLCRSFTQCASAKSVTYKMNLLLKDS